MPTLRRLAGAALLVAAYAPLHRLLDPALAGPAGAQTRDAAEAAWALGVSGTVIVVAFAWVFSRLVGPRLDSAAGLASDARHERWWRRLLDTTPTAFALAAGSLAASLAAAVALGVHGGAPTSVDEMVQLLHAGALADGRVTLPVEPSPAAWIVQNGIVVEGGWASVYPPMHTLLLALGLRLGAPWLIGPLAIGAATYCVTRVAETRVGRLEGRLAGALLAVSPFWLLLGATPSSHPTAAAALAATALAATRARGGAAVWALATGAAVGVAVSTRPWIGLVCGAAIVGTVWAPDLRGASPRALARRALLALAGGLPFAALLLTWNARLFGGPLRLGYEAAFGPSHGLGFHVDPWGNRYGLLEAVAYTGSDLSQLGVRLFESPLPFLGLLGVVFLRSPLARGSELFVAWAVAGVGANAWYWHHGIHFGPRMLFETLPAWAVLFACAASTAWKSGSAQDAGGRFLRWVVVIAVVGGLAFTPPALLAPRDAAAGGAAEATVPTPDATPAIVFVHGSWSSRVAAHLAAAGMRRDSIETALRRNDICAVDRYARARSGRAASAPPELDFVPRPGTAEGLATRSLSRGNQVRIDPEGQPDEACLREARSDRLGVLELELVAWRHPHLASSAVQVARDLGPAANLSVLAASERTPYLLIESDELGMRLLGYAEGMELLWGGAAGSAGGG